MWRGAVGVGFIVCLSLCVRAVQGLWVCIATPRECGGPARDTREAPPPEGERPINGGGASATPGGTHTRGTHNPQSTRGHPTRPTTMRSGSLKPGLSPKLRGPRVILLSTRRGTGLEVRLTESTIGPRGTGDPRRRVSQDRKSTRLNSSHVAISYAVFCLKKKRATDRRQT